MLFFVVLMGFGWLGFLNQHRQELAALREGMIHEGEHIAALFESELGWRDDAVGFVLDRNASPRPGNAEQILDDLTLLRDRDPALQLIVMVDTAFQISRSLPGILNEELLKQVPAFIDPERSEVYSGGPFTTEDSRNLIFLLFPSSSGKSLGWVVTAYDLERLLQDSHINQVSTEYVQCFSFTDVPVYMNREDAGTELGSAKHKHRFSFSSYGGEWTLDICPDPEFLKAKTTSIFSIMPLLGTLLAVLVAWFIYLFLQRSEQIQDTHRRLQESEQKFRTIFESSPIAILRFDPDGMVTDWNPSASKLFSMSGKSFRSLNLAKVAGLQSEGDPVGLALGGQTGTYEGPCVLREDIDQLYVTAVFLPIVTPDEAVAGGIAVIEDVTKRFRADKLRDVLYTIADVTSRVEKLDELFNAIQISLSEVIETSNIYIALHDKEEELLSFPFFQDEFDEQPPPLKLRKGLTEYVIRNGQSLLVSKPEILRFAEEGKISIEGTPSEQWLGSPLLVEDEVIGVIALQSYRDSDAFSPDDLEIMNFVSDQVARAIHHKENERAVAESERLYRHLSTELLESNNMKELLLDIITHDLKNPAGVISSISDVAMADHPGLEELQLIRDSSNALLEVIDNAHTLSQVTLGAGIDLHELNLHDILQKVSDDFEPLFHSAGKTLKREYADDLRIVANPILSETIVNFLSNAIKYAPENDTITLAAELADNEIRMEVRDNGSTIPLESREAIFARTVQLESGVGRGRGLGLAIVRRIAEAHGGEAGVRSNKPAGNVFFVNLPVKR